MAEISTDTDGSAAASPPQRALPSFSDFLHQMQTALRAEIKPDEDEECVICSYEWDTTETVPVRLPCQHLISRDCVERWFQPKTVASGPQTTNKCPFCRKSVFQQEEVWQTAADVVQTATAQRTYVLGPSEGFALWESALRNLGVDPALRGNAVEARHTADILQDLRAPLRQHGVPDTMQPHPELDVDEYVEVQTRRFLEARYDEPERYADYVYQPRHPRVLLRAEPNATITADEAMVAETAILETCQRLWRQSQPDSDSLLLHPASGWALSRLQRRLRAIHQDGFQITNATFEARAFLITRNEMNVITRSQNRRALRQLEDVIADMVTCALDAVYAYREIQAATRGDEREDEVLAELERSRQVPRGGSKPRFLLYIRCAEYDAAKPPILELPESQQLKRWLHFARRLN